jgi:hypothetical protein
MKKGDRFLTDCLLYCMVTSIKDHLIKFTVINGEWNGTFNTEENSLRVHETKRVFKAKIVYDIQDIPRGLDYNEAIEWIKDRLASGACGRVVQPSPPRDNPKPAEVCKNAKLRTVILEPGKRLIIDPLHKELRLFNGKDCQWNVRY